MKIQYVGAESVIVLFLKHCDNLALRKLVIERNVNFPVLISRLY